MKEVSIIIINYHTFALTCDCIHSIFKHVKHTDYEIVLVDNGSTEEESMSFQRIFPNILYLKAPGNLGFAKGNNYGIENAKGRHILLLNSDTVLLNDAVSLGLDVFKRDPSIGVISGQLQYPDGTVQPVASRFSTLSRIAKDLFRLTSFYNKSQRSAYYLGTEWDYHKPVEADWVWGAFFLFLRDDLKYFPGNKLHDAFFMYYEDVQWCYHFKKVVKKKVIYTPEPKVIHFMGKSDKGASDYDQKYFNVMLPNEHRWMRDTKGRVYTSLYYFLKSVYYFSLRRKQDVAKGRVYLGYVFKK